MKTVKGSKKECKIAYQERGEGTTVISHEDFLLGYKHLINEEISLDLKICQ